MTHTNRPRVALDILAISQTEEGRDVMSWAVGMDINGIDLTHLDTRRAKPNGELASAHCIVLEINPSPDCPESVREMESGVISIPVPHVLLVHTWESLALPHVQTHRAKCRLVICLTDPGDLKGAEAEAKWKIYCGAAIFPTPDRMKSATSTKFVQEIVTRSAIAGVRETLAQIDASLTAEHSRRFAQPVKAEGGWNHAALQD